MLRNSVPNPKKKVRGYKLKGANMALGGNVPQVITPPPSSP